jgi:hypothetical protein
MIKKDYIPVEGHPGLYRDPASNAIINTNKSDVKKSRLARQKAKQRDEDIENLKNDMAEIKSLLKQMLER